MRLCLLANAPMPAGTFLSRRVPTELNTADVFTKTLGEDSIYNLRPGLTGYGELPPVPEPLPT